MRDRPRKRLPGALTGAVVMTLALAGLARATDVPFATEHTVDAAFDGAKQVFAADVDVDGDLDVLGAATGADDVAWWENTAGDGSAWTKRIIDGFFDFVFGVYAEDIDGDGDIDVLGAAAGFDDVAWWENTAGRPQGEPFLIGSEGDRNPEVSSEEGNFTVVWERPLGPRSATFGQLIDPEGRPVGSEFRVSGSGSKGFKDEETGGARPAVAYAPHGAIVEAGEADVFAVIWGDRSAADEEELRGQRYAVTADLLLAVFDDPDPLPPGASALVYTVVVQNLSTADAADVVVIHRLPAGVSLVFSQGCAEDPAAAEICTLGTVEGGGLRQYVLETRVAPGISGTLPLPATVSSSTPDPDQNDNVADELTRFGIADLEVEISAAATAGTGERALWQLAVTNAGPSPADGSVLAVDLPLGVAVVASDGCGEDPSATETCTLGTLAAGAERRVELEVEYARTLTGTVTPAVSVASGVYDPDLASNTAAAAIEVLATGLQVEIEAPARVAPGTGFTYTVTVTNAGTSPAAGVELIVPLPAGLSLVATSGCAEDPSGMPVCTLGTLDPGAERRVKFVVAVPEDLSGTLSFGISVGSSEAATMPTASAVTVVGTAEVLELVEGRFAVRVEYRNQHGINDTGAGQAIPFSENTGFFYFFDPSNVELIVKVLDGGAINGHFWFFYGALTDLVYEVLVRDRLTGWERRYYNPAGEICGQGDTTAFPWSKGWHLDGWQGQTSLDGWQGQTSLDGWQGQTTPTMARTTRRSVQVPQASDVKKFALACPGKQGQGVPVAADGGISSHHHRPDEPPHALPLPPLDKCTPGAEALPLATPHLSPSGGTLDKCTPGAKALCLSDGRFRVEVTWRNQHGGGVEGPGRAVAGTDDSGYFWFFDADNLELAVKLLDGRGVNGWYWFFYGGLSDVEYWITVTDTETGESRNYHNPPGEICGGADVRAF
ncbi:MAG: DUF11 domain-containing protein [bacterium]|nr:DUF11 domain-containing protein [bacterium]